MLIAWERKSFVIFGAVVGVLLGFLVYLQRKPVYQSAAQVLVVKKRSDALPVAGGDPRLSFYEDYVSTHLVLIRSPLVVERAVKKRSLHVLPSLGNEAVAAGTVATGLTASRDNKDASGPPSNIINLSYRGGVAEDCGLVLGAIIDSYRDFLDETYRNVSDNTL